MSEGGFDALLSSVLGNEELMKKISGIASSHSQNTDEALPEVVEAIASSMSSTHSNEQEKGRDEERREHDKERGGRDDNKRGKHDWSKSTRLLVALKPYLSDKRGQMIDNILRVEQIAQIIKIAR